MLYSFFIGNIARSKNSFLLVVWIVFVMLSTAYCGYQIIEQILKYYQYNVVTSTESINEVPTNFPAIDICKKKGKKYFENWKVFKFVKK